MTFNLNDPNTVTASITILVEIILIIILIVAINKSEYFSKHNYEKHLYAIVIINLTIIITWMIPREFDIIGNLSNLSSWLYIVYGIIGVISIISAVVLSLMLLFKRNVRQQEDLTFIKRIKILTQFTLTFWCLTFVLGVFMYLSLYVFA